LTGEDVRVSTSEETTEFRPIRIAWRETDEFSISGVDGEGHFKRSVLRFGSKDEAQHAASMLKGLRQIEEELLTRQGEISLNLKYESPRFSWNLMLVFLLVLYVPFLLVIFAAMYLPTASVILFAALLVVVILLRWPTGLLVLRRGLRYRSDAETTQGRLNGPYKAWLCQQPDLIQLRTGYGTIKLKPKPQSISWKDPQTLIVKTGYSRLHLEFLTSEDAAAVFQSMMRNFQEVSLRSCRIVQDRPSKIVRSSLWPGMCRTPNDGK
jgi:hypothetical protein